MSEQLIEEGCTTWPRLIAEHLKNERVKDKIEQVAVGDELITWRKALKHPQFSAWFLEGFGGMEGCKFTAWSKEWVYFPVTYDGSEWVGRVPRNPCAISTEHFGGG
jgi:hypothetical protein